MKKYLLIFMLALFGAGSVFGQANALKVCETIAALKQTSISDNNTGVIVLGSSTKGDGGGGIYYFNSASTAIPDDGDVVLSNRTTTGRWLRMLDFSGGGGGGLSDGDKGDIVVSSFGLVWNLDGVISASIGVKDSVFVNGDAAANINLIQGSDIDFELDDGPDPDTAFAFIRPNAVDYSQMQQVSAASRLLGRGAASAGNVQEIDLGAGLVLNGTTLAPTNITDSMMFSVDWNKVLNRPAGLDDGDDTGEPGSGEDNTAASLGTGWSLPYDKSGTVIRFNSVTNGTGLLSSSNANVITFSIDTAVVASQTDLTTGLATKANTSHTHAISDVTGLQAALDAKQTLDSDLTAIAALTTTSHGRGLLDDADAAASRASIEVVIGTHVQAYDADLDAVAGLASSGLIARTGAGTAAARTITGDSEITVSNGNGASGNPTLAIASSIARDTETTAAIAALSSVYQPLDADLTDLADGSLTGTKVEFSDPDSLFSAANVAAAIAEFNDSINAGSPNGAGAKVHWSQLLGVPAGFADNTDDGSGGGEGIEGTMIFSGSIEEFELALSADDTGTNWIGSGIIRENGTNYIFPGDITFVTGYFGDLVLTNALLPSSGGTGKTNWTTGTVALFNGTNAAVELLVQNAVNNNSTNLATQDAIYDLVAGISAGSGSTNLTDSGTNVVNQGGHIAPWFWATRTNSLGVVPLWNFSSNETTFAITAPPAIIATNYYAEGPPHALAGILKGVRAIEEIDGTNIVVQRMTNFALAEGLAIDITNPDGISGDPTIAFDPTELTGNRTWGNGSDASILWTFNLSGTDPVLTIASGLASWSGFALPTAAGSSTLATSGQLALNSTDKQIGIFNGAREVAIPLVYSKEFSFDPKAVCDGAQDRLFLFKVGSWAPKGIIITGWRVSFEADPTTEVDLDLKRADAFIGVANSAVMDVLDTTAGVSSETSAANINSGAVIANGKVVYLEFGTAYTETTHQMIVEIEYEIEED